MQSWNQIQFYQEEKIKQTGKIGQLQISYKLVKLYNRLTECKVPYSQLQRDERKMRERSVKRSRKPKSVQDSQLARYASYICAFYQKPIFYPLNPCTTNKLSQYIIQQDIFRLIFNAGQNMTFIYYIKKIMVAEKISSLNVKNAYQHYTIL